jgi:hypothetical protein
MSFKHKNKKLHMPDFIWGRMELPLPSNDEGKIRVVINERLTVLVKEGTDIEEVKKKYEGK